MAVCLPGQQSFADPVNSFYFLNGCKKKDEEEEEEEAVSRFHHRIWIFFLKPDGVLRSHLNRTHFVPGAVLSALRVVTHLLFTSL